ncbi:Uncharacterised protein [Mycobacteroides abscessus subsp. massiliense]|nr:hypothetical protein [Mycobacteroides chelonae]RIU52483.1 hypothetical protein D2F02_05560 [Mycobacteroides abscessus]SHX53262.1 Uncharacterised protein [Mycobacteroides abscessus subsp. abscessus]SKM75166.1 Uncharacterised protein [Mycobacteroides abscessus subsp. massiliense]SKM77720.1 Uncharacterised protein [Mycobacteroides abscessus subsp. massiliense]
MSPISDLQKPTDDSYGLVQQNWPTESEGSYRISATSADDASTAARTQAESADDAARNTDSEMQGRTADSVSGGYTRVAEQLRSQSTDYTTISGWMTDAGGKVEAAKRRIRQLVATGTQEIRDVITSETAGTPVTPSSSELTDKYRNDIQGVAAKLETDLDGIGHSLHGDAGSSSTPSYVSVPTMPSTEHPNPSAQVVAYNQGSPEVAPQQLPPMPRATQSADSPTTPGTLSAPTAPTSPHAVNPTLAGLISGSGPSGNATAPSTSSPHGSSSGTTPAGKGTQSSERHQPPEHVKSAGLPNIPSIPLPDIPTAAQNITTAVSSAVGTQLPITSTAPSTPGFAQAPVSTGFTPGVSGTPPMPAGGLAPIGGVPTPTVQAPPVSQGTPASPPPGVQTPSAPQSPAPAAPRGPVADLAWIQKSYGLSPSLDLPKSETTTAPVLFIAELPAPEAHLHRALASLRQQFEELGWSQPLAVATVRRGLEARTVYVTADGLSIHPSGVSLPDEVLPMDEMAGVPATSELLGSLMVTDKLVSLIPEGWGIEGMLSTLPSDEQFQTSEQFRALVEAEELMNCTESRGRSDVTDDEALSTFARVAIGSAGCSDLDTDSARLQAARWVGTQPSGYGEVLSRWYLSDAAEAMSAGRWGEAVYSSERYMNLADTKKQVA